MARGQRAPPAADSNTTRRHASPSYIPPPQLPLTLPTQVGLQGWRNLSVSPLWGIAVRLCVRIAVGRSVGSPDMGLGLVAVLVLHMVAV